MNKILLTIFLIALAFFLLWLFFGQKNGTDVGVDDKASLKDIADAQQATKDVVCILISVQGISPHNNKNYEMGTCELNWLIENRGWKVVSRPNIAQ